MFGNMGNLAEIMRNVGKIQENVEKATENLGKIEVEGGAGGGSVVARANGKLELLSVRIDPKLLSDGDAELLEDLVVAAVNQAMAKGREAAGRSMQEIAGNLPIPGMANFLGQIGGR